MPKPKVSPELQPASTPMSRRASPLFVGVRRRGHEFGLFITKNGFQVSVHWVSNPQQCVSVVTTHTCLSKVTKWAKKRTNSKLLGLMRSEGMCDLTALTLGRNLIYYSYLCFHFCNHLKLRISVLVSLEGALHISIEAGHPPRGTPCLYLTPGVSKLRPAGQMGPFLIGPQQILKMEWNMAHT